MHLRSIVLLALPLTVGACARSSRCCPPCPCDAPPSIPTPSPRAAVEPISPTPPPVKPSTVPSIETTRLAAALLVKELSRLEEAPRGARLAQELASRPSLVEGLSPAEWARLAPDSLRVYDASHLVEVAPDLPVSVADLASVDEPPARSDVLATNPRLMRFAHELRTRLRDASVYVHSSGALLVASNRLAPTIDVEIEHAARVEPSVARIDVDVFGRGDAAAARLGVGATGGAWIDGTALPGSGPAEAPAPVVHVRKDAPALAATPSHLGVCVPSGSRIGAKRTVRVAYIQDFDAPTDAGPAVADPIVGTIEAGLVVHVTHRPAVGPGPGSLVVELAWSELVEPIPTFQTTLTDAEHPVTIDLPEVRLVRRSIAVPAIAGMAAFVDLSLVAFHVRVAALDSLGATSGPLVRRIDADPPHPRATTRDTATFRAAATRSSATHPSPLERAEPVPMPVITTEFGSEASLAALEPVSYVQDFDVERTPGAAIANPIIATASPGIEVRVRPRRDEGARVVAMTTVRVEDLLAMRRVRTSLGRGAPVTIELPRTRVVVETSVDSFAPGEARSWALGGPAGSDDPVRVSLQYVDSVAPASTPAGPGASSK